jgi:hypothetical protein
MEMMSEAVGLAMRQLLDEQQAEIKRLVDAEVLVLRHEMLAAIAEARASVTDRMLSTIEALQRLARPAEPAEIASTPAGGAKPN